MLLERVCTDVPVFFFISYILSKLFSYLLSSYCTIFYITDRNNPIERIHSWKHAVSLYALSLIISDHPVMVISSLIRPPCHATCKSSEHSCACFKLTMFLIEALVMHGSVKMIEVMMS